MRTLFLLSMIVALVTLGACGNSTSDTPSDSDTASSNGGSTLSDANDACPSLVGSWELISIAESSPALSGSFETDPDYQIAPTLKILNETHWMFIRQSSDQFIHSQGGHYTLDGDTYTETVEFSAIPSNVGKSFTFECHLEGDSLWHHVGGIGDSRYDESWRRVY